MERSSGGKKEDAEKRAPLLADQDGGRAVELLPPDGGWGWMVSLGSALSNIIMYPVMQTFALVYKDKFTSIGLSATDISVLINVNSSFGLFFGLVQGMILKRFGYRKVAIAASFFAFVGVLATSFGNSFLHFFIAYGLVTSLGLCMVTPAFSLALNSYFKERRGKAMGLAMTLTGIGPMVMPLLISQLLAYYGVTGTGLIMSALSLHSLVGALLLQPVKWHMRPRPVDPAREPLKLNKTVVRRSISTEYGVTSMQVPVDHDIIAQNIYGIDTPILQRREYPHEPNEPEDAAAAACENGSSGVADPNRQKSGYNWWSVPSVDSVHLGSSVTIFDEKSAPERKVSRTRERKITIAGPIPEEDHLEFGNGLTVAGKNDRTQSFGTLNSNAGNVPDTRNSSKLANDFYMNSKKISDAQDSVATKMTDTLEEQNKKTFWKRIAKEMDLSLLKDLSYINLLFGMSIAMTAEINFSLLTPLILADLSFTDNQIALTMSTIAAVDIVFRFLSPFFADYMHYSAKTMYLISMGLLIASRTTMMFFTTFVSLVLVSVALGVAKGVRTVYMSLVIPESVPLEKLASASGMQMVVNAVIFLTCGPFIGYVRDASGTYNACIIVINTLTLITMIMWLPEILYKKLKAKRTPSAA
ncbi:monocarboxylate transporter 13-like [Bacillus rossius redtenbacheri]|uniref:monocarboxylate transporter 13-like n=1 Tax=Bacillus rossius redtenbacheri TaxID=93214 RepID=UPI002FDDB3FB